MLETCCGLRSEKSDSQQAISREVGYNRVMEGTLTRVQRDILVGLLLGDGSLEFNGCRGTRLQVKQAAEKRSMSIGYTRTLLT